MDQQRALGTQSKRAIPKIRIRSDFTGQSKRMCRREGKQGGEEGGLWSQLPGSKCCLQHLPVLESWTSFCAFVSSSVKWENSNGTYFIRFWWGLNELTFIVLISNLTPSEHSGTGTLQCRMDRPRKVQEGVPAMEPQEVHVAKGNTAHDSRGWSTPCTKGWEGWGGIEEDA